MIARTISSIVSGLSKMVAPAGAIMLVAALLSTSPPAGLADPGGNGKGNGKGGENGNGGNSGAHGPPGGGSAASGTGDATGDAAVPGQDGAAATSERSGRDYVPNEVVVANLGTDARTDIRRLGF